MGWPTECPECSGKDLTLAQEMTVYSPIVEGHAVEDRDLTEPNNDGLSDIFEPAEQPVRVFCGDCGHYLPPELWREAWEAM